MTKADKVRILEFDKVSRETAEILSDYTSKELKKYSLEAVSYTHLDVYKRQY